MKIFRPLQGHRMRKDIDEAEREYLIRRGWVVTEDTSCTEYLVSYDGEVYHHITRQGALMTQACIEDNLCTCKPPLADDEEHRRGCPFYEYAERDAEEARALDLRMRRMPAYGRMSLSSFLQALHSSGHSAVRPPPNQTKEFYDILGSLIETAKELSVDDFRLLSELTEDCDVNKQSLMQTRGLLTEGDHIETTPLGVAVWYVWNDLWREGAHPFRVTSEVVPEVAESALVGEEDDRTCDACHAEMERQRVCRRCGYDNFADPTKGEGES